MFGFCCCRWSKSLYSLGFLDSVTKSKKPRGNTMIPTSDTNKHQTFSVEFLDFTTKPRKLENIMILTSDISKIQTFPRVFWVLPRKSKQMKSKFPQNKRIQRFCEVRHQVQTRTQFSLISRSLCLGHTLCAICFSALFDVWLDNPRITDFVTQLWVDI